MAIPQELVSRSLVLARPAVLRWPTTPTAGSKNPATFFRQGRNLSRVQVLHSRRPVFAQPAQRLPVRARVTTHLLTRSPAIEHHFGEGPRVPDPCVAMHKGE
jgi:hypothetical protein